MKRIISLLVVMAMMLASVLAIIPVSATVSPDSVVTVPKNEAETTRFLSESAYNAFKEAFEGGAATNAYVNSVTPFAFNQAEANAKFENKRILEITLPVKTVGSKFTISVYPISALDSAQSPVAVHEIAIDPATVEAGKMATIDLSSYNIVVGNDQTLAFGSATDTFLPAWYGNTSALWNVAQANAPYSTGIVGNTGKSNADRQPSNSIFMDVVMRDATDDDLIDVYGITQFLSADAFQTLKAHYEGSEINASAYVPSVAPFVIAKNDGRAMFANKRILSITLPVEQTGTLDANGDLTFTITVFKIAALNSNEAPVATYTLKFNAAQYGLEGGKTNVHKFVKFDLANANIVVGEGEVIGLSKNGDTLLPAYNGTGIGDILTAKAPYAAGFGAYAGTDKYNANTWPTSHIYFDVDMVDAQAGLPIYDADDFAGIENGKTYFLVNDITLPANWETKALENVTLNGCGKTITLTGANGLFANVTGSTLKDFTLAGGTVSTGVAKVVSNVTFKNITVNVTKIENSGDVGAFATSGTNGITVYNCTNNAEIKGANAGGLLPKKDNGNATVSITRFYNNGNITGGNTAGGIIGWYNASETSLTFKECVNTGTIAGTNWNGGLIGTMYSGGGTFINCVNGVAGDGSKGLVTTKNDHGQGGLIGEAHHPIVVQGGANYANIDATHAAGVVGCMNGGTLTVDGFTNYGNLKGGTTAGAICAYYRSNAGNFTATNCTNLGTMTAGWCGGFVGAFHKAGVTATFTNCVNGQAGNGAIAKCTNGGKGTAGFIGQTYNSTYNFTNCTNYADIEAGIAAGLIGWHQGGVINAVNCTNAGTIKGGYAGGMVAALQGANVTSTFDNCHNTGAVMQNSGATGAGGFIGELGAGAADSAQSVIIKNSSNTGAISANSCVGGLIAKTSAPKCTITVENTVVKGSLTGNKICGGGIVGSFNGTKFVAKNVTTEYSHNVGGDWNKQGGGFVGHVGNNESTLYFTDCVNNTNFDGKGGNPGGFIGGSVNADGTKTNFKKAAFLRCVNNGNLACGGCAGGFVGQNYGRDFVFIDCVNNGNVSSSGHTASGFVGWGEDFASFTFINCVNNGELSAPAGTEWATAFVNEGKSSVISLYGCANYGNISAGSRAHGLVSGGSSVTVEKSFNAATLTAPNVYEFSNASNTTIKDCISVGSHKNLIDRLALVDNYGNLVEQDKWAEIVAAFAAAKAVYDNADSTNADKKAVIAVIDAITDDLNTYVYAEAGATFADPSLKINVSIPDAKSTDYVALVKDGDTDATIKVLYKNVTANFDIFTVDTEEGKQITEGNYKLYLLKGDVELADAIADNTLALDVAEVVVDVNVIKTAEQFAALSGKDGNYILGADLIIAGGVENFSGNLDGKGHTIYLGGTNGAFKSIAGSTIKNLKLESGDLAAELGYGLVHQATGNVKFENIEIGMLNIKNNDRAGALLNTIEDNNADIVITNVTSLANVHGYWMGGGIIGRAYVKSATLTNVVNGSANYATTVSNEGRDSNYGAAGIMCDVAGNITMNNVTNYATVKAGAGSVGGIMAQLRNQNNSFVGNNVVNNGNVSTNNGWPCGASGMIGAVEHSVNVKFTNSKNNGNVTAPGNMGGFIGYTRNDKAILSAIFENCENNGNITSNTGNIGGFLGQITSNNSSVITFTDCINRGNVTTGATADLKGLWAGGFTANYTKYAVLVRCYNYGTIASYNIGRTNAGSADGGAGGLVASGITSITDSANYGKVISDTRAGGIIYSNSQSATFTNVTNYGEVVGPAQAGGIAGSVSKTQTFDNVKNLGNVTSTGGYAAGFLGYCEGTTTIKNSANGSADAINGITISGGAGGWKAIGGIIGYGVGTIRLENVDNYAKVSTTANTPAGGIMGMTNNGGSNNSVTFIDVNNYGDVYAADAAGEGVAGMIGDTKWVTSFSASFTDCGNYGNVYATAHVGGYIGWADNSATFTFTNCVNSGNLSVNSGATRYVGGFLGRFNAVANFTDCVNNGTVLLTITNADNVAGSVAAGFAGNAMKSASFDGCTNNGYIESTGAAAGFVAGASATIANSANNGALLSENGTAFAFAKDNNATITESTNTGATIVVGDTSTYTQIWTAEDFMNMNVNGYYVIMDNIVLPADYQAIELGAANRPTVIEGNDKIIYMKDLTCGLFTNMGSVQMSDLTLVGSISGPNARGAIADYTLKSMTASDALNIVIDNVIVDVNVTNTANSYVGGLIGSSGVAGKINLTINNTQFLGNVTSNSYAGGLVGHLNTNGTVTVSDTTVGKVGLDTTVSGVARVGGFFAKLRAPKDAVAADVVATISDSTNFATIKQVNTGAEGIAGGIFGRVQHISVVLDGVENYGDVSTIRPTLSWGQGTGGLVGEINSNAYLTILSSANYGDVTTDKGQIGGFVGVVSNRSFLTIGALNDDGTVNYDKVSYNYGSVTVGANANEFAGGIVGATYNNTIDSTNLAATPVGNGNDVRIYGVTNYANVYGEWWCNLGGIMGGAKSIEGQTTTGVIEIIGAVNYGRVETTASNAGGMIGQVGATTLVIKNCENYGYIKTNSANGAAGIISYIWSGTPDNITLTGNVNFGTIENAGTGAAAGIAMQSDAKVAALVSGNMNFGTVFAGGNEAGIVASVAATTTFSANVNYGLIIEGAQLYKSVAAGAVVTSDNVEAGAVITDSELIPVAKSINAADYIDERALIGEERTIDGSVDLSALAYLAFDANGIVGDFDQFYTYAISDNAITTDVTNTGDYADLTSVEARSYAAKLANVSTYTDYVVTFEAMTTGEEAGFVYAISPAGTVKTFEFAIDEDDMALTTEGYAQFMVEYNGLNATLYVLGNTDNGEEWYAFGEALLEDGAYAAIGVTNGASEDTYDDEGALTATFVDNKQVAAIANVEVAITYNAGGIINAFRALDLLARDLADVTFYAADLAASLDLAIAADEAAATTEAEAAAEAELKTQELAQAILDGKRDDELDPYEAALDAAIVVYEKAHRAHTLTTKALEAVAANKAIADEAYAAVKATYKADVEKATANIYETIDAAINHGEFMEAAIKLMALGDKFTEMYDDEVVTTVENAIFAGLFADTQEEIDAQVEIINSYVDALDWSTFNHWVGIIRSFDSDDYTIFTWAEFVEAINAIATPDTYETQDDIDAAVESIKTALDILKDDIYQAEEMQKYLDETLIEREWIAENYTPKSWAPFYAEVIKPFQDAITALAECTDGSQFNALEAEVIRLYNLFNEDYTDITTYTELVWIKEINELLAKADEVTDGVVEDGEPEYSDITKLYLLAVLPEAKKAYNLAIDLDTANTDAQDYVAKATEILKPVVEALADVTALKAAIAEYEAAVEGIVYTVESWNDYQIALATAEFVVVTAKTTAEADEALAALTAAYEALVEYVAIDLADLDEAIAAAEALNKADYTSDSWDNLRDALVAAKIAAYSDDQDTIDAAYAALVAAIDALTDKPDTAALEALIAEVAALNKADYTAETWLDAALAIAAAKAVLNSDDQAEITAAKAALEAAKAALVKKAAADNTALKALITEIEALKSADYTAETWADLQTALTAAKAALESDKQTDLDIAKATLAAAKAGLDKVVVETEVEEENKETAPVVVEESGCKSAIGATVVVMTAVLGLGATVVLKKKED